MEKRQTDSPLVFVNCFILEIYTLNGRKVVAYILKKLKKGGDLTFLTFVYKSLNT